jgi:hypothetical protein
VTVAGLKLLVQSAWLPHYPFWSLTMIVIDLLIIYGLIAMEDTSQERPERSSVRW